MPADYRFGGFDKPTYTQIPDQVLDELMPILTEAELKVLLYVCRRTFGFHKDADAISLSQMVEGITTQDGTVLDRGTGMSRSSVRRGIQGLLDKAVLTMSKVKSEQGDYETNVYALHVREGGSTVELPGSKLRRGVVPRQNHRGPTVKPRVVLRQNPQQTGEQQTVDKREGAVTTTDPEANERDRIGEGLEAWERRYQEQERILKRARGR